MIKKSEKKIGVIYGWTLRIDILWPLIHLGWVMVVLVMKFSNCGKKINYFSLESSIGEMEIWYSIEKKDDKKGPFLTTSLLYSSSSGILFPVSLSKMGLICPQIWFIYQKDLEYCKFSYLRTKNGILFDFLCVPAIQ